MILCHPVPGLPKPEGDRKRRPSPWNLVAGLGVLALGSGEVTLIEMTRAFAAIAANAESVEPYAVRTIRNGDQVLFTRAKSELQSATNPGARAAIHDLLASVVREGTGRAARINGPAAGKTGTSQSYRVHT
jgi:penicillin-binding protein 1A